MRNRSGGSARSRGWTTPSPHSPGKSATIVGSEGGRRRVARWGRTGRDDTDRPGVESEQGLQPAQWSVEHRRRPKHVSQAADRLGRGLAGFKLIKPERKCCLFRGMVGPALAFRKSRSRRIFLVWRRAPASHFHVSRIPGPAYHKIAEGQQKTIFRGHSCPVNTSPENVCEVLLFTQTEIRSPEAAEENRSPPEAPEFLMARPANQG